MACLLRFFKLLYLTLSSSTTYKKSEYCLNIIRLGTFSCNMSQPIHTITVSNHPTDVLQGDRCRQNVRDQICRGCLPSLKSSINQRLYVWELDTF